MKRILLSLLCGTGFIITYFLMLYVLIEVFDISEKTIAWTAIPFGLPKVIYIDILQQKPISSDEEGKIVIGILLYILFNGILYSIPFYLLFTLFAKLNKKHQVKGIEEPLAPPTFE